LVAVTDWQLAYKVAPVWFPTMRARIRLCDTGKIPTSAWNLTVVRSRIVVHEFGSPLRRVDSELNSKKPLHTRVPIEGSGFLAFTVFDKWNQFLECGSVFKLLGTARVFWYKFLSSSAWNPEPWSNTTSCDFTWCAGFAEFSIHKTRARTGAISLDFSSCQINHNPIGFHFLFKHLCAGLSSPSTIPRPIQEVYLQ